jgi:hypothetical protein
MQSLAGRVRDDLDDAACALGKSAPAAYREPGKAINKVRKILEVILTWTTILRLSVRGANTSRKRHPSASEVRPA